MKRVHIHVYVNVYMHENIHFRTKAFTDILCEFVSMYAEIRYNIKTTSTKIETELNARIRLLAFNSADAT